MLLDFHHFKREQLLVCFCVVSIPLCLVSPVIGGQVMTEEMARDAMIMEVTGTDPRSTITP